MEQISHSTLPIEQNFFHDIVFGRQNHNTFITHAHEDHIGVLPWVKLISDVSKCHVLGKNSIKYPTSLV